MAPKKPISPPPPPPPKPPPLTPEERRANIDKALEKVKEANQGTTGSGSSGSGSKEYVSGLATSGGKPVYLEGESEPLTKQRVEEERKINQQIKQEKEMKKEAEVRLIRTFQQQGQKVSRGEDGSIVVTKGQEKQTYYARPSISGYKIEGEDTINYSGRLDVYGEKGKVGDKPAIYDTTRFSNIKKPEVKLSDVVEKPKVRKDETQKRKDNLSDNFGPADVLAVTDRANNNRANKYKFELSDRNNSSIYYDVDLFSSSVLADKVRASLETNPIQQTKRDELPAEKELKLVGDKYIQDVSKVKNLYRTKTARGEKLTSYERIQYTSVLIGENILAPFRFAQSIIKKPSIYLPAVKTAGKVAIGQEYLPEAGEVLYNYPYEPLVSISSDILIGYGIGKVGSYVGGEFKKFATTLEADYTPVYKDVLKRRSIEVPLETKNVKLDLVPEGKGLMKNIDVDNLIIELKEKIPLKETPKLPKVTKQQARILEAVKESGDQIGGSFAQETLLKKGRGFEDIDIISQDIDKTAKIIEKNVEGIKIKDVDITDSPLGQFQIKRVVNVKSGKVIADIDPIKFAEEGLAVSYNPVKVEGVNIINIEPRLGAKALQFARGKRTDKVIEDISLLSGGELQGLKGQSVRGGFGFTFEEQAQFVGKTGDIATAQRGLFPDTDLLKKDLFASPFDIETGNPQLRVSRLGLNPKKASILDILSGDVSFSGGKPQAIIFENIKIADIPSELKPLYKSALAGDDVAKVKFFSEYKKFQSTPTREFKPFGYQGSEAELTLPAGETIKKVKRAGVTLIDGKRVEIIQADIIKSSPELSKLQDKFTKNTISVTEKKQLKNLFKQETGFDFNENSFNIKPVLSGKETLLKTSVVASPSIKSKIDVKKSSSFIHSNIVSSPIVTAQKSMPVVSKVSSKLFKSQSPKLSILLTPKVYSPPAPAYSPPTKVYSPPAPAYSPPTRAIPIPKRPPTLFPPTKKEATKKKKKSLFQVQIRRQGKFKPLAQLFGTKQQAEIAQKIQIEKTLAASGRVIDVNTDQVVRPSIIPQGFYQSRKERGVVIQKRGQRLGRRSEVQEIQSAKRMADNIRNIFGGRR